MSSSYRFLFHGGIVCSSSDTPPVSTFLESHSGAYTTTRTHKSTSGLLFWERHLRRLANSARILFDSNPKLLFKNHDVSPYSLSLKPGVFESTISSLVDDSVSKAMSTVLKESRQCDGHELAVTALVSGDTEKLSEIGDHEILDDERILQVFNVSVHIGTYAPCFFGVQENAAQLALVGPGRDVAAAKYSDWARLRKPLEKLRLSGVTELLLSNDGTHILEGCITNFFVVCRVDNTEAERKFSFRSNTSFSFEVQTAPLSDGLLPGVIRGLVIEVCLSKGIPVREVAPSWAKHELWEEAFITSSLRVMQHVTTIKVPSSWKLLRSNLLEDISWEEKRFKDGPGMITKLIQDEIMQRAALESTTYLINSTRKR